MLTNDKARQGCSQDFSKGVGALCQSEWYSPDCHYDQGIVMGFSPPVVDCLVKKGLQKGGSQAPHDPPALPLLGKVKSKQLEFQKVYCRQSLEMRFRYPYGTIKVSVRNVNFVS